MPRFSLRQILLAVVALALGLSIWRLAQGSWIDIPLAVLSFYFAISLCRHAAATRRLLAAHPDLARDQQRGGWLLIGGLIGTAGILLVAWVFRLLAAGELCLVDSKERFVYDVRQSTLPLNLTVLAILVATGLTPWQFQRESPRGVRQGIYGFLAATGTLTIILAFWAERLLVVFLVYLAISAVESFRPPASLPPDIHPDNAVRIHHFMLGSVAGLPLVIANVGLIAGMCWVWRKPGLRWLLAILLSAGLAAQCWVVWWIGAKGLRQLSPAFQESVEVPPISVICVVGLMVMLAATAFTWRILVKAPPHDDVSRIGRRALYFHENWLGGLLLGLAAMAQVVFGVMSVLSMPALWGPTVRVDLETIYYLLTSEPAQIISIAAAVGGMAVFGSRWPRRNELVADTLPSISPVQFVPTSFAILILVVTSAPIVAAASFSYWFVRFGY